ncbi:LysR family transcriptional regulator [Duganella sp. Root1480D1]|uniref:LysR family transcriptional regulator n=1 Tax=Duganella sp. Root1480D1 TaxID=1736471 RepID=UPI00070F82EE|nr:LysR family transcriptional regulator [Duganella sp. Root1480D1]KQZ34220.1 LysR family transcriptional regulator [Duganella sp. Root1480D1]
MDKLDALRVFCAVVETGGFSRAAEKLGISTSSVTAQVNGLEAHFHVKLMNRTTRSMSLTGEGRECYEQAQRLLAGMQELQANLQQSTQEPRGTLRVNMPGLVSRLHVAPALPQFLARYPGITVQASASDRMVDMVDEGYDVLLRLGDVGDPRLVARPLLQTRFVCCASPAFVAKHGTPTVPEELAGFDCLHFILPRAGRLRGWQFADGAVFTPPSRVSFDHVDSLVEACKAGAGIGQFLSLSVEDELRNGTLVPLLADYLVAGPTLTALYQQRHQRAAKVQAFIDFLGEVFA